MEEYDVKIWRQQYAVRADWSEPSCRVEARYQDGSWFWWGEYEVMDFFHSPAEALVEYVFENEEGIVDDEIDRVSDEIESQVIAQGGQGFWE